MTFGYKRVSGDAVEERYMGGSFCSMEYSRSAPAPADLFGSGDE